jgi:adenosylcobyric acid synthase
MSKALMIQGTGSGAGKSLVVAGLCRILSDLGVNVAPFKSQNMALNSFITKEGGEIGRAQALQAEAARVEPSVDMNPILLKASSERSCHVVMNGKVYGDMMAVDYYRFKEKAWDAVTRAYERLSRNHDLIVIEGAGSPAEINLMEDEIVNMRIARHADASVLLVGDIDKGGVFASFHGTVELLRNRHADADYIKGFIINKFRGDVEILKPAFPMIEERTGRPVIGVIPYLGDLGLHEEDGIPPERLSGFFSDPLLTIDRSLKIVVLRLRYISNFTDFDPFLYEPDVDLVYSLRERDIESADMVIIPGSKNTVHDLLFLREHGIERSIIRAAGKGTPVVGVCGGYQMLGNKVFDPLGIESHRKEVGGLGLLDIETVFEGTKVTAQVEAWPVDAGERSIASDASPLRGYEIHMGRTTGDTGLFRLRRLSDVSVSDGESDGTVTDGSAKKGVWGTYIHGIFDHDGFRRSLLNRLRRRKKLEPLKETVSYGALRENALNRWADTLRESIDMKYVLGLVGNGGVLNGRRKRER